MNETAFILERYAHLTTRLQQSHYEATTTIAISQDHAAVPVPIARDIQQLRTAATISSSTDKLPSLDDIIKILDAIDSSDDTVDLKNTANIVYAFGLLTAKLYAHTLSRLLESLLCLNACIAYWESIRHSKWNQTHYIIQTLPVRIHEWIVAQYQLTIPLSPSPSPSPALPQSTSFIQSLPTVGLQLYYKLRYNYRSSILLPREIHSHLKVLKRDQQVLASWLGGLSNMSSAVAVTSLHDVHALVESVKRGAEAIRDVDTRDDAEEGGVGLFKCMRQASASTITHTPDNQNNSDNTSTNIARIKQSTSVMLRQTYQILKTANPKLPTLTAKHGPPSPVLRHWPRALPSLLALNTLSKTLTVSNYTLIATSVSESFTTIHSFAIDWILKPLQDIYMTIRHREPQLVALGSLSLDADMASLGRMVLDFAQDYKIVGTESPGGHVVGKALGDVSKQSAQVLIDRAKMGDISIVLERYEDAIKHPLRGAIAGDLIRSLLIQIQQAKVQLELAMSALDKLLKSNELNFAFLAVVPSLLVTYGAARLAYHAIGGQRSRGWTHTRTSLIKNLRDIERTLNTSSSSDTRLSSSAHKLNAAQQGLLLVHMTQLRKLARALPRRGNLRTYFVEDVRDIENGELSVGQRLRIIDRMWRMPLRASFSSAYSTVSAVVAVYVSSSSFGAQAAIAGIVYVGLWCHTLVFPSYALPVLDVVLPVIPFWMLVTFGAYALGSIGFALWSFPDVEKHAFDELMMEVEHARRELRNMGVDC
ncbi:hypothetical protein SeMB42_g03112 [Synchytrium endobioticum]|uniref:Uncharacterized protein n=1 Tax=Synchytrium endobioticum TaxID=286115 RepID=A0A507D9W3_9FUNG|nr:hypothetical protein SeMB42_g03112 [Synchytrium endobioticum]